jgi:hypothetical protein|tara:strand:+ start:3442 stop:4068 length:627 start_codon:yes stop_codon:yes gene_type:complete
MIGLNNNPYLDYSKHVDTEYLETNKESVITAIANCDIESWGLTGSFCNVLESIDSKHTKVKNHKNAEYDLSNVKNPQLFEQLYFEIYNVGHYKYLKKEHSYTGAFWHFSFMQDYFESLPFKNIREILLMVLPAGNETLVHRDPAHLNNDRFIYLRPNLNKPFFVYDKEHDKKHYVDSLAAEWSWHDWHGADAQPHATYAFKVKGELDV